MPPREVTNGQSILLMIAIRPLIGKVAMTKESTVDYSAALVGFGRLATDAIAGLTDVVEAVHRQIAFPSRGLGPPSAQGFAAGIATLVDRKSTRLNSSHL